MKLLSTSHLIPGMKTAKDIKNFDEEIVLKKGTVLTDSLITKLDIHGVMTVYVEEPSDEEPNPEPKSQMPSSSYTERVAQSTEFETFKKNYQTEVNSLRGVINNVVERNITLNVKVLLNQSMSIISGSKGQVRTLDMLQNIKEYDNSTFAHCLNVSLICNLLAGWLNMSEEETEMATACGLLHDIGKLLVPHDLITKPGKLSNEEYSAVKKHTIVGYQLLKSQNVDDHICNAALMHHERCDGTGYPLHLEAHQIDKYAKLVAIADVYDALTAARVYRGPLCPFKVIEILESEGLQKYDVKYIQVFLENVVNTYVHNRCYLSSGQEGTIVYINPRKLSRPLVQCGSDYINLIEHPELEIEYLI